MEFKTLSIQGIQSFYRVGGSGRPVVLIHGFGEDGDIWTNQAKGLATRYRIIVPDLPGSGKTGWFATDGSFSGMGFHNSGFPLMEDFANWLLQLLQEEGIDVCCMIGHSMGGYISLAFAELYPNRLSGLGLFHSTASADSAEKKVARQKGIGFIRTHGASAFLQQAIPNLFGTAFQTSDPQVVLELVRKGDSFQPEILCAYYEAMMQRPDRKQILQSLMKPVLFTMGEEDKAVLLQEQLSQCFIPEESFVNIWKSTGHMGMLERPEQSLLSLLEYLEYVHEN